MSSQLWKLNDNRGISNDDLSKPSLIVNLVCKQASSRKKSYRIGCLAGISRQKRHHWCQSLELTFDDHLKLTKTHLLSLPTEGHHGFQSAAATGKMPIGMPVLLIDLLTTMIQRAAAPLLATALVGASLIPSVALAEAPEEVRFHLISPLASKPWLVYLLTIVVIRRTARESPSTMTTRPPRRFPLSLHLSHRHSPIRSRSTHLSPRLSRGPMARHPQTGSPSK